MLLWLKRLGATAAVALVLVVTGFSLQSSDPLGIGTPAVAQTKGSVPGFSVGGSSDSERWRAIRRGLRGNVSIPDKRAGFMIQSEGENWRAARNGPLSIYGLWLMGGVLALLLVFYLIRGRIRIEAGFSGRLIERFTSLERFSHWLTATSFVVLGLTGLNMLYGRYFLKPLLGPDGFSTLSAWGKYAHDYVAFAFMLGLVMMIILWIGSNLPTRADLVWLAKGGGMFSRGSHPPAYKFNAGQKILFWLVVLTGASLSYTGLSLLYPFTFEPFGPTFAFFNLFGAGLPTDLSSMQEMQLTQLWHAILALVMIAVILAHIYIGTLGMEGAYDAMGNGFVDQNWASEHHAMWVEEIGVSGQAQSAAHQTDD